MSKVCLTFICLGDRNEKQVFGLIYARIGSDLVKNSAVEGTLECLTKPKTHSVNEYFLFGGMALEIGYYDCVVHWVNSFQCKHCSVCVLPRPARNERNIHSIELHNKSENNALFDRVSRKSEYFELEVWVLGITGIAGIRLWLHSNNRFESVLLNLY